MVTTPSRSWIPPAPNKCLIEQGWIDNGDRSELWTKICEWVSSVEHPERRQICWTKTEAARRRVDSEFHAFFHDVYVAFTLLEANQSRNLGVNRQTVFNGPKEFQEANVKLRSALLHAVGEHKRGWKKKPDKTPLNSSSPIRRGRSSPSDTILVETNDAREQKRRGEKRRLSYQEREESELPDLEVVLGRPRCSGNIVPDDKPRTALPGRSLVPTVEVPRRANLERQDSTINPTPKTVVELHTKGGIFKSGGITETDLQTAFRVVAYERNLPPYKVFRFKISLLEPPSSLEQDWRTITVRRKDSNAYKVFEEMAWRAFECLFQSDGIEHQHRRNLAFVISDDTPLLDIAGRPEP